MPPAPLPLDEADRLQTLQSLQLLDTPREPVFDRITKLTRALSGAEVAAISLVDESRQWFKSICGLSISETPREQAFCDYTAQQRNVLWIEDARLDPRFADNGLVTSGQVIFYAGAPLVAANGQGLGALCILSTKPRAFDPKVAATLAEAAALVMDAIMQRLARREGELNIARGMVRDAPTSIAVLDRDLRFSIVSKKMEETVGTLEAAMLGDSVFDHYPELRPQEVTLRRALAGETLSGKRAPFKGNDGRVSICDWEIAPWRDPEGVISGVRVMTFDLTELVRSQRAAERSEERLKLAIDVAETMVWELDFKSRKVESVGDIAHFFDDRLGHADFMSDLLGVVHPDDRPWVEPEWSDTISQGLPFGAEFRLCRPGKDDLWVMCSAEVFKDAKGSPARIIGALRDVTSRKQKDFALERAREAAEAASRAKSEFLANMSHEIRTPLNGVMGVAGALERTLLTNDQREMVRLIEGSAKTLESLLSDILDLARIESGRLELRTEVFSLSETISSVSALFSKQAQAKGIGFNLEQPDRLAPAYVGDPTRLRQVFSNLLSNAIKFTHRGAVTFRIDRRRGVGQTHHLRFQVTDTGVGFDEAVRDRLFARFEQADGSITRQFGGTGLGLAISQSIAEGMGGGIEATSVPGVGSTFTFVLPLEPMERAEAPKRTLETAPTLSDEDLGRPLRVLLAEDHPVNRKVVELILSNADVDLISVGDGAQALEAFCGQGDFDMVLMDMQMPVMDGLSSIRAIRAWERQTRKSPTPIFALTANAMPEHVESSVAAGADGHLSKPIAAATLLGVVEQVRSELTASPEPLKRIA